MSSSPEADARYDWASTRGDHWLRHVEPLERMFESLDEPLLGALRIDGPVRIAEAGSGGGGFALKLTRTAPAGSHVDGFDVSPALVHHAQGRAGAGGPTFQVADMSSARPPGELYDGLVSRLGVMFFEDDEAAFQNLSSWIRPGGRFAFAVWGSMESNVWSIDPEEVAEQFVEIPQREEGGPGPERYADTGAFMALLERCGFRDLQAQEWRGLLPVGGGQTAPEAARFVLSAFASVSKALDRKGGDAREQAESALAKRWKLHETGGRVELPALVHIVHGAV